LLEKYRYGQWSLKCPDLLVELILNLYFKLTSSSQLKKYEIIQMFPHCAYPTIVCLANTYITVSYLSCAYITVTTEVVIIINYLIFFYQKDKLLGLVYSSSSTNNSCYYNWWIYFLSCSFLLLGRPNFTETPSSYPVTTTPSVSKCLSRLTFYISFNHLFYFKN
jgi:hypothetical protein